jgi:hypothetical protein
VIVSVPSRGSRAKRKKNATYIPALSLELKNEKLKSIKTSTSMSLQRECITVSNTEVRNVCCEEHLKQEKDCHRMKQNVAL